VVWSNRDKRTLLDKMLNLISSLKVPEPCYFVADTYYAAGKVVNGLLRRGNHLVSRVKSNAVAFLPAEPQNGRRKRGIARRSCASPSRTDSFLCAALSAYARVVTDVAIFLVSTASSSPCKRY
jgi:hypothetical protein